MPIAKKWEAFFDKNYALFFAPVIVLFLYMCSLWRYGAYPFGDGYTVASYDLSAQICPFIEHLFDVINGKSTLTYSYGIVGGADVTGTFLYFFVSPFSFLFLVFGEDRVAHASSIVMMGKLAVIAISGAWFSKKMFRSIPDYLCIFIGVAYTYCGYTFVANTYINWLDFLIYLPLCAGAFRRFVTTGKYLRFSVLTACCVYTCFSIACFSMLTAFPCLIAYGLLCVKKEERKLFLTNLCIAFVIAIIIALPILVPALMATMNSARTGGLFDNLWFGFKDTADGLSVFDKKAFLEKLEDSTYKKLTYILTDSVFVVLTIIWFFRRGLKDAFARFMLVAGVLTLLPVFVDESMILLNMGSYYSYSLRFGFLNALFFLGGACLCLEDLCFKHAHAYDGVHLYAPLAVVQHVQENKAAETSETSERTEKAETIETTDVAETVETVETVETTITPNSTYTTVDAVPTGKPKKSTAYCVCSIVLIVVGLLAAVILALVFIGADRFVRMEYSKYTALVAKITAAFPASWKSGIENICSTLRSMGGSFTHSLGKLEVISVLFIIVTVVTGVGCLLVYYKKVSVRLLSYVLIAVVSMQILFYNGQIVIGNRSTQFQTLDTYVKMVERLQEIDDDYYRIKDFGDNRTQSNGSTKLNETLMSNAPFIAGSNCFSVFSSVIEDYNFTTYPLFWYSGNSTNSLKSLGRGKSFADAFLGYKYFWVPYKSDDVEAADELSYLEKVYTGEKDANGNDILLKEGPSGNQFVLYKNTIVFPNGYVLPRGDFRFPNPNDKVAENRKANQKALYEFLGGTPYSGDGFPGVSQTRALSKILNDVAAEVVVEAGKITAKATAEKDGDCLFLSFVASRGYTVTVNGKKAKLVDNDLHFLSVALEEGENEVVFTYSSPYVKYAAVGTCACAILLFAAVVILKKTKWVQSLAPVISWAGVIVAGLVVAFFMIFPTGVFITKLIELIKLLL